MRTRNEHSIPDRTRPGSTTSAQTAGNSQGGSATHNSAKHATGDQRANELKLLGQVFTVGTWNVRTLSTTGKLKELCHTMEKYTWNVIGLAEVRWTGTGEVTTEEGHKLWYMGEDQTRERGVAFMVHKKTLPSIIECRPISSRLISIRIAASPMNITIIQVHAPTSTHTEEEIEDFYQELNNVITNTPKNDIQIIQGDWNAKVGPDAHTDWAGNVGKFGWGETNDRGIRLLEFARFNNFVLANTLFDHKASRRITWHSPNMKDHNQIDYILFPRRFLSGIRASRTKSFPGADVGSDHELVMMTVKIKLKKLSKSKNPRIKYNLEKLKDTRIQDIFQAKLGGRFAPLLLLSDPQDMVDVMTKDMNEVAEEVLGIKRYKRRPWVTDDTLLLCDKRREKKASRHKGASSVDEYRTANNTVRNALRGDKERWINNQCQTLETNLKKGNTKEAFSIVKKLTNTYQAKTSVIEDKNGVLLTEASSVTNRWREYCQELFNHEEPTDPTILEETENGQVEEEMIVITRGEVIKAVSQLKHGKVFHSNHFLHRHQEKTSFCLLLFLTTYPVN